MPLSHIYKCKFVPNTDCIVGDVINYASKYEQQTLSSIMVCVNTVLHCRCVSSTHTHYKTCSFKSMWLFFSLLCILLVKDFGTSSCITLSSSHIVVTTVPYSYFVIPRYDNTTNRIVYSGLCFDIINYITNKYNLTYEVKQHHQYIWGMKLNNGEWNGMIGELVKGRSELAANDFTINYDRAEAVEFSAPYSNDAMILVLRHHHEEPFGVFQPLEQFVWICCVGTTTVVGIVFFNLMVNLNTMEGRMRRWNYSLCDCVFFAVTVQLN